MIRVLEELEDVIFYKYDRFGKRFVCSGVSNQCIKEMIKIKYVLEKYGFECEVFENTIKVK